MPRAAAVALSAARSFFERASLTRAADGRGEIFAYATRRRWLVEVNACFFGSVIVSTPCRISASIAA